jgi:hypothetical protein
VVGEAGNVMLGTHELQPHPNMAFSNQSTDDELVKGRVGSIIVLALD